MKYLFTITLLLSFTLFSQTKSTNKAFETAQLARDSSYALADSLVKIAIEQAESQNQQGLLHEVYYLASKIQSDGGFLDEQETYLEKAIEALTKP